MDTKESRILPARVDSVRRRFEAWRRTRRVLSPIPEPLWAAAVEMAGTCGISRTAKALRVNYNALRKRVEHQAVAARHRPEENSVTTFLELAPPPRVGSCQCTLELEDVSGAKMRVHLQGAETPDLAVVAQALKKCALPPRDVIAWCAEMAKRDRVGFIFERELGAIRNHFETLRPP